MNQEARIQIIVLIWIFISGITGMFAQSCLPDGITFDLQSKIDNFQTNYPGCTIIEGDVYIEGDDIHNLDGLSVVTAFNGNVIIRTSSSLHYLNGLNNVTSIDGDLKFEDLWNFRSMSALSSLSNIGGDLFIQDCDSLQSFEGFENLTTIGGSFYYRWTESDIINFEGFERLTTIGEYFVVDFTKIENFVGLNNLATIGKSLSVNRADYFISFQGLPSLSSLGGIGISDTPLIQNFGGLENIDSLGGNLYIEQCDGIVDLTGLESLSTILGRITVSGNPSLIHISQLSSLTSMGDIVSFHANNSLTSLSGIDNIDPSSWIYATFQNNPQLSNCAVQSICEYIANQGYTSIAGNAEGCDTEYQVQIACESISIPEQQLAIKQSAYPNPFTTSTAIEFEVYTRSNIQYTVYNSVGEAVFEGEDRNVAPGNHTITPTLHHLPSGLYFAVLRSEDGVNVVKLVKQ